VQIINYKKISLKWKLVEKPDFLLYIKTIKNNREKKNKKRLGIWVDKKNFFTNNSQIILLKLKRFYEANIHEFLNRYIVVARFDNFSYPRTWWKHHPFELRATSIR